MTRTNAISLLLAIVLVLAILVAPLAPYIAIPNVTFHFGQTNTNSFGISTSPASGGLLACDGCPGGGPN